MFLRVCYSWFDVVHRVKVRSSTHQSALESFDVVLGFSSHTAVASWVLLA